MHKAILAGLFATTTLAASGAVAELSPVCAENLARERITLLVPTSAGGGYDTYARAFAPSLEKYADVNTRVVNMTAGGGRAARSMAQNADGDDLTILIENATYLVTTPDGDDSYVIDSFETLGLFHVDEAVWITAADFDFAAYADTSLVAGVGGLEEALFAIILAGSALDIEVDVVAGYDGPREAAASIIRGEVDVTWISQTSGVRIARDEALKIGMLLSDGPTELLPDTPYLAGEGSISWQMTEALDEPLRTERRQLAQDVASLMVAARGLHISKNVPEQTRDCLSDLMSLALADADFVETAVAQGREVAAVGAEDAQAFVTEMVAANLKLAPLAAEVTARYGEN